MQVSRPLSDPNPRRLLFEWLVLIESVGRQNCRVEVAGKLPLLCDLHSTFSLDAYALGPPGIQKCSCPKFGEVEAVSP